MKFIDVNPEDVPNIREAHRGRVSYPILKSFMETNKVLVKLDRTGVQQTLQSLTSSLGAYIRNHELPIKMFMRGGEIYLLRLDRNDDGTVKEDYKGPSATLEAEGFKVETNGSAPVVDGAEVKKRFEEEKHKVTK